MCVSDIEFASFYDFLYWILEMLRQSDIVCQFITGHEKSIMIMYLLLLTAIFKKWSLQYTLKFIHPCKYTVSYYNTKSLRCALFPVPVKCLYKIEIQFSCTAATA